MKIWKIGLVGCGEIAEFTYLPHMHRNKRAKLTACCDIRPERAKLFREKFGIEKTFDCMEDMLSYGDFDIVMDTASIPAHYELNMQALRAGKHLYSQKPIGLTPEQATDMIEAAKEADVKIAASPIHMLRPDIIEAKRLISCGVIGKPLLARAVAAHGGPEYFQYRETDPSWFYEPGAGALYDLGVHALHQVTGLLGAAKTVSCTAAVSEPNRTIRSGAYDGKPIDSSKLFDNYMIHLNFGGGCIADVVTGFCMKAATASPLEVYGECGSIIFTDDRVNPLKIYIDDKVKKIRGWIQEQPQSRPQPEFFQCSCIGDLIESIETNREPKISATHARHVIEIMCAVEACAKDGAVRSLTTTF